MLATTGIICIVFSHEHYTVDILIAYYVCTNHFWMYHAMANDSKCKSASPRPWKPGPHLTRVWWWRIFIFMEGNISNTIPLQYQNPLHALREFAKTKFKQRKRDDNPTPEQSNEHVDI